MVIFERRVPPVVRGLMAVTLLLSIACALDGRTEDPLYQYLGLWPARVWQGEVWRLVTWPFVYGDPIDLLLALVVLFRFGSELEERWGTARLGRYVATVLALAGVGTCAIALALPGASQRFHLGGFALTDALAFAWALQFPTERLIIFGMLRLAGRQLVALWATITLLLALYLGIAAMLPELIAAGAAIWHGTGGLTGVVSRRTPPPPPRRTDDDDSHWVN